MSILNSSGPMRETRGIHGKNIPARGPGPESSLFSDPRSLLEFLKGLAFLCVASSPPKQPRYSEGSTNTREGIFTLAIFRLRF